MPLPPEKKAQNPHPRSLGEIRYRKLITPAIVFLITLATRVWMNDLLVWILRSAGGERLAG